MSQRFHRWNPLLMGWRFFILSMPYHFSLAINLIHRSISIIDSLNHSINHNIFFSIDLNTSTFTTIYSILWDNPPPIFRFMILSQGHIISFMRLCDLLSTRYLNVVFVTPPLNTQRLRSQQAYGSRVKMLGNHQVRGKARPIEPTLDFSNELHLHDWNPSVLLSGKFLIIPSNLLGYSVSVVVWLGVFHTSGLNSVESDEVSSDPVWVGVHTLDRYIQFLWWRYFS